MKSHKLKIIPKYFKAIIEGRKQFEIRENRRMLQIGTSVLAELVRFYQF